MFGNSPRLAWNVSLVVAVRGKTQSLRFHSQIPGGDRWGQTAKFPVLDRGGDPEISSISAVSQSSIAGIRSYRRLLVTSVLESYKLFRGSPHIPPDSGLLPFFVCLLIRSISSVDLSGFPHDLLR